MFRSKKRSPISRYMVCRSTSRMEPIVIVSPSGPGRVTVSPSWTGAVWVFRVLVRRAEDSLHSSLCEPCERLLDLRVRFRILELEKVEVALLAVEMEPLDPVIVSAERDLRDRLLAPNAELLLQVQQTKIVVAD